MVDDDYKKKAIQDEIAMEKFVDDLVVAREDLWVKPENFEERFDNHIAHLTTIFQRFREMVLIGKVPKIKS